ncbi:unnamed protein product [Effrenium voratum]|uniref:Cysteine protease n=1 Tax=Effrenium voratum TaxID=2562239 RepID=A0AA36I5W9_9DINO|nr:unnamed protein product [Effrenium voratum]CAJ1429608.1 unnamed protein product [Effrenium voratum]|mmetsp:Transcript_131334/g.311452  ORF Transcript_131334/g.311452 Transcript_131334/m.311452 type:complete len:466 (+) Transcript_131334:31-1428(+)
MMRRAVAGVLALCAAEDPSTLTTSSPSLRVVADDQRSCAEEFEEFIRKFGKKYDSLEEKERRAAIFCQNLEFIKQRNSEGHNYTVGVTPFADMTTEEFRSSFGLPPESRNLSAIWGGLPEEAPLLRGTLGGPPDSVDWRRSGAVSVVQNQGHCGACWTFATAGAIEGAWKVAGGSLYTLSEQQLLDCADDTYHNSGCKGGNPMNAFVYVRDKGLCTARSYNYRAVQSGCQANSCTQVIPPGGVRGYRAVAHDSESALMEAVAQQPVSVAIDGDSVVFQLYTGGVITGDCFTKIDHGVLLVGYGNDGGTPYWIIKNSWGASWGEDGFGRLSRKAGGLVGECGILSDASYPVLNKGKVVPGTWDPDPGTVAGIIFAVICGCCVAGFMYSQLCARRNRRQPPLLASQPAQVQASRFSMPNPWARQAVTPAPAPSATAPYAAQPAASAPPQAPGRSGNSAPSRLLQQNK